VQDSGRGSITLHSSIHSFITYNYSYRLQKVSTFPPKLNQKRALKVTPLKIGTRVSREMVKKSFPWGFISKNETKNKKTESYFGPG
jgi:hypothetical protein